MPRMFLWGGCRVVSPDVHLSSTLAIKGRCQFKFLHGLSISSFRLPNRRACVRLVGGPSGRRSGGAFAPFSTPVGEPESASTTTFSSPRMLKTSSTSGSLGNDAVLPSVASFGRPSPPLGPLDFTCLRPPRVGTGSGGCMTMPLDLVTYCRNSMQSNIGSLNIGQSGYFKHMTNASCRITVRNRFRVSRKRQSCKSVATASPRVPSRRA